ncbi:lycopene cyclase [Sulfolobus acidocaldarius SUSAZ]|nr:lycopene cyclase [Sulfolobus acidocaldarius SUSAZ]
MMFIPTLILSLILKGRNYLALLSSVAIVSPLFLYWDFFATAFGSWSFNRTWVLGVYVINLPIEEVMFFIVTPFATLLIYDILKRSKGSEIRFINRRLVFIISALLVIVDLALFLHYSYTFIVILYLSMSLVISAILDEDMLRSTVFWKFMGLTYVPFLVFDYFLTSIPIVLYGVSNSILGVRVLTIPIEDFIYSFSMIMLYTLFYRLSDKNWIKS